MTFTFRFKLEGINTGSYIRQEGDPINGYVLLEVDPGPDNADAIPDSKSRYNIDQRSGFKVLPGVLVKDGETGALVALEERDPRHPQRQVRVRAERLTGAKRPEVSRSAENFIDDPITTDDL